MRKRFRAVLITVLLAIALTAAAGCGKKEAQPGSETHPAKEAAKLAGNIIAVGSTAMQPFMEEAAKRFMEQYPGVQISVQGGGSGTGLSQVSQGACDIGMSDIFAEEKEGIDATKLKDHPVIVQAFAVVTHPDVGVESLTKKQLQDIFTRKITNWKEVGGKNQKIFLVNRAKGSGTRATFKKYVLEGIEEAKGDVEQDSSGAVHKIVSETPGAISYLGIAYLDDKVKPVKIGGAAPTEEDISTGKYPFWAFGHLYTKGEPSKVVKAFIDFVLSNEVQNGLVREMHYFPVKGMKVERRP
ncbi:phosphate ABC transporter substrate-binding protein (PhoT family) [Thermodesulfitimonas autotrophica]|uniref:Phosphate-binding protein n=1 Tax=Thermodesulfitimonas autotrophica TaxID=1894989 RepID=A0A3N5BS69_9THEO|nr:phosphate ABC transporter substrate-binding protein (PhoT family) [Thermodesulfitimonas autotrophica]